MPKEIERAFEKEYGKKRGDLIFFKWESKHGIKHHHSHRDYCPRCRKEQPFIKHSGEKMCKVCGHQEKDKMILYGN